MTALRLLRRLPLPVLLLAALAAAQPVRLGGRTQRAFSLADAPGFGAPAARIAPRGPDTIEVVAFLVEFKREEPDNPRTTGRGSFGDTEGKIDSAYKLEPPALRRKDPQAYFHQVLRFVANYWKTASGEDVVIEDTIFTAPANAAGERRPYQLLKRPVSQYSPAEKAEGESNARFNERRLASHLQMVCDAVRLVDSVGGPFQLAKKSSPRRHRVHLLIHAGASRLTDGGTGGTREADTPSDWDDFIATPEYFQFLDTAKALRDTSYRAFARGIPVAGGADTVSTVMMISETASQDGLNFGIGGLLVEQVGRFIGLPDTYDWARGVSMMGAFDGMDVAGFLSGDGFLPVLPSAWPRLYMGWADRSEARPDRGSDYTLAPPGTRRDSVLVVRLDGSEYLLVENRQRSPGNGLVSVRVWPGDTLVSVPSDSVSLLFQDSICNSSGKACRPNARRARGVIVGGDFDAALPGSGLLVWHVNDWLLRERLRYGEVNVWGGAEQRDRYRGIYLVEADGRLAIGQEFRNAAGQPFYDFGSGADVLPHVRRDIDGGKEVASRRKTVTAIGPFSYASTQAYSGARTGITLRAPWDEAARQEDGAIPLDGDSVVNLAGRSLSLAIEWGPLREGLANFPVDLPPAHGEPSLLPARDGSVWVVDTLGRLQLVDAQGRLLFAPRDTLLVAQGYDSAITTIPSAASRDTLEIPVSYVGEPLGRIAETALLGDTVVARTHHGVLSFTWLLPGQGDLRADTARYGRSTYPNAATAGPLVAEDGRVWIATAAGNLRPLRSQGIPGDEIHVPGRPWIIALASAGDLDGDGLSDIAGVDTTGRVHLLRTRDGAIRQLGAGLARLPGETFRLAVADFDRDDTTDFFILGSRGIAAMVSAGGRVLPGWPQRFQRGVDLDFGGRVLASSDSSAPALGDVNGDGYPEAIFTGHDLVYAVDRSGLPLQNWPYRIRRTELTGGALGDTVHHPGVVNSSPLLVDLDRDGRPEVLVATPDGEVVAIASNARAFVGMPVGTTAGTGVSPAYAQSLWPVAVGGRTGRRAPWVRIAAVKVGDSTRLYALSSASRLQGLKIPGAGRIAWGVARGGAARTGRLSSDSLAAARGPGSDLASFHFFPNPLSRGQATVRYDLGRQARRVTLTVYDQTGHQVLRSHDLPTAAGRRQFRLANLLWGTGVYAARLEVDFADGGSSEAWFRLGVQR